MIPSDREGVAIDPSITQTTSLLHEIRSPVRESRRQTIPKVFTFDETDWQCIDTNNDTNNDANIDANIENENDKTPPHLSSLPSLERSSSYRSSITAPSPCTPLKRVAKGSGRLWRSSSISSPSTPSALRQRLSLNDLEMLNAERATYFNPEKINSPRLAASTPAATPRVPRQLGAANMTMRGPSFFYPPTPSQTWKSSKEGEEEGERGVAKKREKERGYEGERLPSSSSPSLLLFCPAGEVIEETTCDSITSTTSIASTPSSHSDTSITSVASSATLPTARSPQDQYKDYSLSSTPNIVDWEERRGEERRRIFDFETTVDLQDTLHDRLLDIQHFCNTANQV